MAGRSPAPRRRRNRGWSSPSKSSRKPQSPGPSSEPPLAQKPPLAPGTEVEVRVDDDGFHGSWFEAIVDGFLPARGRGSRARYTVTYTHLLSDDSGGTLVEPFPPTHIRPRPPPPSTPVPVRLHDIVEAFHNDGWWSGILLATDPLTAAFPVTREVITFKDPQHVRPRRDYVDGQWVPSQAAVSVKPKRAVRVYEVGDKVEVVRDREIYGYSWFPATVAKVVDKLSYLVEYSDLEEEEGGGKAVEYLHCLFIRPDVEHTPRDSEFRLGPGAAVEAYCDGAWSPGVVKKAIGEGEYEVIIDGKEEELSLKKVAELLKPQYKWDGKHWRIVSPKEVLVSYTTAERKRGTKKVSGRQKECSVERQLERWGPYTHQQVNGNLEEEVNVSKVTNQELSLLVPPGFKAICNGQGLLDGGKMDERPIQLHIENAGSSQSTMDNTILRSCSVVGTSLHPTFPSCERVPFVKASPIWDQIEPLEVFRKVPQQPHFLPLQQFMPELREGMAIGLMVTYATLVESVKKSCINDNIDLFERKINALAHLEENGFDVKSLQHSLNKLVQIKWDHTQHLGCLGKLKELLPGKETAVSQKCALLDEKEGAIHELEQRLECLRGEAEKIAREAKHEDAELSRLKVDVNIAQEACSGVEMQFHSTLAELGSRLLSD
uniref:Uncharacterized protein n=1 Tax=Avena sativa TaxID=4498 RepID=A0ACD5W772_AVESA